ncbi:hypothetical protein UFOVP1596_48 [uncultured Caudovirales phage]|uniref:Uncharacterized protein n=1 Tax=uncultured Caudovirales phage TaxID=2100421 RepID=A0A6J5SU58_9CAUD|nr:hypothetical protein UFOVP1596_48 [uncultured Caudovirales phage]
MRILGKKKYPIQKTGCYSVDLVAAVVNHYRSQDRPLKTIYLRKRLYEQFVSYGKYEKKELFEEAMAAGYPLKFGEVEVRKGSDIMLKEIYWTFQDDSKPDAPTFDFKVVGKA